MIRIDFCGISFCKYNKEPQGMTLVVLPRPTLHLGTCYVSGFEASKRKVNCLGSFTGLGFRAYRVWGFGSRV